MADAKLRADFLALTRKKYADQAKWFLNGFWLHGAEKETEAIWNYTQKFISLDDKKAAGNELDEFWSHKLLESIGQTLTVVELRAQLKKIDLDVNGKMALLEFLAFQYNKTVKQVVDAPQGQNAAEVADAAKKFETLQTALAELQTALVEQKASEEAAQKAEAELKIAVADLKKQEDDYRVQIETLEAKSSDPAASTVSKNKAAAELSQLKAENPLPLRKAKITQDAALRKVEKVRKAAETARIALEQKVKETETASSEAEAYLEELKKNPANPYGSLWWMERELKEAQKYLPSKKLRM